MGAGGGLGRLASFVFVKPSTVKKHLRLLVLLCACVSQTYLLAQLPARATAGEIQTAIQKAQVLGSALYLAAHPDDENTRLIAHFANVTKVETAYLSLTRGDGGQNLIASDIRELLGLTRTQELLAARRIDGGTQFFSRANDFGFSKHPDETFRIWDKQQVLADVVKVIRQWRPDVIVLRFDPRKPGTTHGHHTASAILGMEAFRLAGDPTAFPEQLGELSPWAPSRIYWNAYTWRRDLADHIVQDNVIKVDVGTYLPLLGESIPEIAARSRSQHRSQGFGSTGSRAESWEDLELLGGDTKGADGNPFEGIDISWNRVAGGQAIGAALAQIEARFNHQDPSASVADLLAVYRRIQSMPPSYWTKIKAGEIAQIIADCMGLYLSASTEENSLTPGSILAVKLEATNRSNYPVRLLRTLLSPVTLVNHQQRLDTVLAKAQPWLSSFEVALPANFPTSGPYWLQQAGTLGMYAISDEKLAGRGESPDPLYCTFDIGLMLDQGQQEIISLSVPLRWKYNDPVMGEQQQPFEIIHPVYVEMSESSYLFTGSEGVPVQVKITAGRAAISGQLQLALPEGWLCQPSSQDFQLERAGQEEVFTFSITPPKAQSQGQLKPIATVDGQSYSRKLAKISHDYIPLQLADLDATVAVSKLNLQRKGQEIGYLMGAGDDIPQALRNIGYNVTLLEDKDFVGGDLSRFDAILVGVRAYNTLDKMPNYHPKLLAYVKEGGNLVIQYNTSRGLKIPMTEVGPYPMQISSDRVTVEEAEVRLLAPDHPALNTPNKITAADFEGWVQERGLYFPNNWSEQYTPLISSNDPGEPPLDGGLLVAKYGKGNYVYTGYSFFRELPAGVPGAYRLLVNLLDLGK